MSHGGKAMKTDAAAPAAEIRSAWRKPLEATS
jgi:hypothetical protein